MPETLTTSKTPPTVTTAPGTEVEPRGGTGAANSVLKTEKGSTTVADGVVQKVAAMAAREVDGVARFGSSTSRALGALRERVPGGGSSVTAGVVVEVGETQAAVDLNLVVHYGVAIPDLAQAVRRNVITTVERMTGLEVTEVNIAVDDVELPGAEQKELEQAIEPDKPARVQ